MLRRSAGGMSGASPFVVGSVVVSGLALGG